MLRSQLTTGSVQKEARARGSDVWVYRYRDGHRHRNKLLGTVDKMTAEAAHAKAHRLRAEIFANRSRMTVKAVIDRFIAEDLPQRASTASSYRSMLKRVEAQFAELMFDDFLIDVSAVERWLRDLKTLPRRRRDGSTTSAEPISRRTKMHYKAVLHRLGECAMRWGLVEVQRNPVELVEVKTGPRRKRKPTLLTLQQYEALLERPELGRHGKVMVQLAMCLGLRRSELLGLRWEDIDLLGGSIRIERSSVGKNQDETKTESSNDVLPLHPQLVDVLKQWHMDVPVIEGWVFGSPLTRRPLHGDSLYEAYLVPAAKAIGLQRLGWHDFRHTYRAMLRDLELPLEVQQKLMRHSSITMTTQYGVSPMDKAKREANRRLVEHVSGKQNGNTQVV